jgi:hypothetical protein
MTQATAQKRRDLQAFIEREMVREPSVQGVVGIGSIASGLARPDSDIDAILLMDPHDLYAVPAEFVWRPSDGTYHSIFVEVEGACVQFDFARLDLAQWADPSFVWPEGRLAELAGGWIAFDRTGQVRELIACRTAYGDDLRQSRLDEAITWLDQHLSGDGPLRRWQSLGPARAHDCLHAAYGYLVQALFAYNRQWRPWRNREMSSLLTLCWLPERFSERVLNALNAPSPDYVGYLERASVLRALFGEIIERLLVDGEYGTAAEAGHDPIDAVIMEAFVRSHDEPGRAWNMDDWNLRHRQRRA